VAWTRRRPAPESALLVADAIGLGAYAIVGAQVVERAGLPRRAACCSARSPARPGGAVRDVLCAEIPYVLRRGNLYASARSPGPARTSPSSASASPAARPRVAGSSVTIAVRLASIRWQLELPVYRLETPRPRPLFSARATSRLTGEHPVPRVDDGGAG
jgi:uncharacterized membrane protein YeiH